MPDPASPPAGIVFDMDGLMLDTETLGQRTWLEAARHAGYEVSGDLFLQIVGRNRTDSAALLLAALGPGFDFDRVYGDSFVRFDQHIARHGVPLRPGITELLEELSARRILLGVATSTRHARARHHLERAGLLRYFQVLVGGDEVAAGKPAPDIYLEAARRLGIDPKRSFALEDSFAGVRAAHAAGFQVIMVPDLLPPTPEIAALATHVVASLHEARDFLLPPSPSS
jgi:HAD superfamily hydrolase (TIGR01509 family)